MGPAWLEAWFAVFAAAISRRAGSPMVFAVAPMSNLAWAACGPYFGYSEAWQMAVNTATAICTCPMVFVIQNRGGLAVRIKLDEIIHAIHGAKNSMIDLEDLPQDGLEKLRVDFAEFGLKARDKAMALKKARKPRLGT